MKKAVFINPRTGNTAIWTPAYSDGARPQQQQADGTWSYVETDDEFFTRVTADVLRSRHLESVGDRLAWVNDESNESFFAKSPEQRLSEGTHHFIIHDEDPETAAFLDDRTFRDAWECPGDKLGCNMTKARLIHLAKIRKVRNEELVKLDVPFMRAVEVGDTDAQATIATEKQVLRDIPATFDITTDVGTPELLKAKWPAELPARE